MSTSMALPFARAAARARNFPCSVSATCRSAKHFSTSQRLAVRAVFGSASNDSLRSTLDEIQEKITLPAYLPAEQRRILSNPTKKNYVEQNPVVIEIEGLEHKYTKLILAKDLPNSKYIYKKAIKEMQTPEDWANLESLLAGYKKAGIVLKDKHFSMASRRAIAHGQLYTLIDCARHARDTGYLLTLSQSGLLVLQGLADRAMTQNPQQAIKWLEQVQDILERPPHSDLYGAKDLRSSVLARGMMLSTHVSNVQASETASEEQLNHLKDEIDRVRALWKKILASSDGPLQLEIDEKLSGFGLRNSRTPDRLSPWVTVRIIAHNIKALEAAPKLVEHSYEPLPDASKHLDEYLTRQIEQYVTDDRLQARLPILAGAYHGVLGRAPTWGEPLLEAKTQEAA